MGSLQQIFHLRNSSERWVEKKLPREEQSRIPPNRLPFRRCFFSRILERQQTTWKWRLHKILCSHCRKQLLWLRRDTSSQKTTPHNHHTLGTWCSCCYKYLSWAKRNQVNKCLHFGQLSSKSIRRRLLLIKQQDARQSPV